MQGFEAFFHPLQTMFSIVLATSNQLKVLWSVIAPITILVVDMKSRRYRFSGDFRHDEVCQ